MALVANYASSDEDNLTSDEEEEQKPPISKATKPSSLPTDFISDDEDDATHVNINGSDANLPSILDDTTEDIPGLSGSSKSLFASLPSTSSATPPSATPSFIDQEEDLSTIPEAKPSEKALIPLKPKKRKGPVKIVLPSLSDFDDGDQESVGPAKKPKPSGGKKSALLSLLPAPKGVVPSKEPFSRPVSKALIPDSVARKRPAPTPAQVKVKKPHLKRSASDSEDDDDAPVSFFTLEESKKDIAGSVSNSGPSLSRVMANPEARGPQDRPLSFKGKAEEELLPGMSKSYFDFQTLSDLKGERLFLLPT